jgi:hypothetical protein
MEVHFLIWIRIPSHLIDLEGEALDRKRKLDKGNVKVFQTTVEDGESGSLELGKLSLSLVPGGCCEDWTQPFCGVPGNQMFPALPQCPRTCNRFLSLMLLLSPLRLPLK